MQTQECSSQIAIKNRVPVSSIGDNNDKKYTDSNEN